MRDTAAQGSLNVAVARYLRVPGFRPFLPKSTSYGLGVGRWESNTPLTPSPRLQGKTRSLVLRLLAPHKLRPHARCRGGAFTSRRKRHTRRRQESVLLFNEPSDNKQSDDQVKEGLDNKCDVDSTPLMAKH